jgi:hypothetical protein
MRLDVERLVNAEVELHALAKLARHLKTAAGDNSCDFVKNAQDNSR